MASGARSVRRRKDGDRPFFVYPDVDLQRFCTGLIEGYSRISVAAGQKIVGIAGSTGAGKSALTNLLMGHSFETYETEAGDVMLRVTSDGAAAAMGTAEQSCTLYPEVFIDEASGLYFCDYPGFSDSRGRGEKLLIQVLMEAFMKRVGEIQSLVIVLEQDALYTQKSSGFKKLIENLVTLLPDLTRASGEELEWMARTLVIVFNPKSSQPKTESQIRERLQHCMLDQEAVVDTLKSSPPELLYHAKQMLAVMTLFQMTLTLRRFVVFNHEQPGEVKATLLGRIGRGRSFPKERCTFFISPAEKNKVKEALLALYIAEDFGSKREPIREAIENALTDLVGDEGMREARAREAARLQVMNDERAARREAKRLAEEERKQALLAAQRVREAWMPPAPSADYRVPLLFPPQPPRRPPPPQPEPSSDDCCVVQ